MKYRFKGLDKYVKQLENLTNSVYADICIENAVDAGGKVVDDYTVRELQALPTDDSYVSSKRIDTFKYKRTGLRTVQKQFLIKTFGTSPIDKKRSFINEKTGVNKEIIRYRDMSGYTPAVTLARMLERGTSIMNKNPVFSRASRKARTPCLEAMQESLNKDIERCFNLEKIRRSK